MGSSTSKDLAGASPVELGGTAHAALGRAYAKTIHAASDSCTSPLEQKEKLTTMKMRSWKRYRRVIESLVPAQGKSLDTSSPGRPRRASTIQDDTGSTEGLAT